MTSRRTHLLPLATRSSDLDNLELQALKEVCEEGGQLGAVAESRERATHSTALLPTGPISQFLRQRALNTVHETLEAVELVDEGSQWSASLRPSRGGLADRVETTQQQIEHANLGLDGDHLRARLHPDLVRDVEAWSDVTALAFERDDELVHNVEWTANGGHGLRG